MRLYEHKSSFKYEKKQMQRIVQSNCLCLVSKCGNENKYYLLNYNSAPP